MLADDLGPDARIVDLVGRGARRTGRSVMLRTQLPLVWMACRPTSARSAMMSGSVRELDPVELDVLRVVKWP